MSRTVTGEMRPTSERPVPFTGRGDLVCERIDVQGVESWVCKDPLALEYHRLEGVQFRVLRLLDGERSYEDLRFALQTEFPAVDVRIADVQRLVLELAGKGLVRSVRSQSATKIEERARTKRRRARKQRYSSPLAMRLPGFDPQSTLDGLRPWFGWLFRPTVMFLLLLGTAATWMIPLVQFRTFAERLPAFEQFFGWPNVLWLWLVLGACKVVHEFGHGLACRRAGAECHEMGVMLLVLSPCLYCDVTDAWMVRSKWQRMLVSAAGMYVELLLSAVAILLWWHTHPGLVNQLCLNVFFVTTLTTLLFNANPLLRFDGYYVLADWLEVPNLRERASAALREWFGQSVLGLGPPVDRPLLPVRRRWWFVTYAVAAWCYRWLVLAGIVLFLCLVLKPYGLQSIGLTLAVLSIASALWSLVRGVVVVLRTPREESPRRGRVLFTGLVVVGLGIVIAAIPVPHWYEASFVVQPHDLRRVYANVPGRIARVDVAEGATVTAGASLVGLTNADLDDERIELVRRLEAARVRVRVEEALDDLPALELAREHTTAVERELSDHDERRRALEVTAPISGRVVAPPRVASTSRNEVPAVLPVWSGRPLDGKNGGCFVELGTELCGIAPDDRYEAIVLVEQAERDRLTIGDAIELRFDHRPSELRHGTIARLADRALEFAPRPLSNKYGGDLPTATDAEGRERLAEAVYVATVVLDDPSLGLEPGLRGRARVFTERRTVGSMLWQWTRRTIHFRL